MNERGSELYHIIDELIAIGNMLQLLQSAKNQLLMQQAIYSATVAVDIRRTQLLQSTFVDHISDTGSAPLA